MFCTKCGKEITGGGSFCQHCGAKISDVQESVSTISSQTTKRPVGIIVISIGLAIQGLIMIVSGVKLFDEASKASQIPFSGDAASQLRLMAFLPIVFSGLMFYTAYALWNFRQLGRKLTMAICTLFIFVLSIAVLIPLVAKPAGTGAADGKFVLAMLPVSIILIPLIWSIWFLRRQEVKKLFR